MSAAQYRAVSYRFDEVVWGARFVPGFEPDADGSMGLNLERLSEIAPVRNTVSRTDDGTKPELSTRQAAQLPE